MKKFKRYASAWGAAIGAGGLWVAVKTGVVAYLLAKTPPEQHEAIYVTIGAVFTALGIGTTKFVAYFFDNDPNTP